MKLPRSYSNHTIQILNNMKSIKLYAWSSAFTKKLNYARNDQELGTLRKIGAVQAFANFTWSTTPFFVSCSTFALFIFTETRPLTTDIVFPALTLFNILTFPLAVLPMMISAVVEASVAVERLTSFLLAEEVQENAILLEDAVEGIGKESVAVRDASFTWNRAQSDLVLENINFTVKKGQLACIIGKVGSGKSSFLQSLLGDLWKMRGDVVVRGTVAYVAQSAWVTNATIRDNIVFGHRWNAQFYEETLHACALSDDIRSLPNGDQTEVGERGISLSGGQKARLTLARAVYARADIYLLDDILSAVDQHVGRHLINHVLGATGLLATKTKILATNSIPVLKEADNIILLEDGHVIENGSYADLLRQKSKTAQLIQSSESDELPGDSSDVGSKDDESERTISGVESVEHLPALAEDVVDAESASITAPVSSMKSDNTSLRRASMASSSSPRRTGVDEESQSHLKTQQNKEFSEQGKVKWSVYAEYAKTSNLAAVSIYLLMLVCAQTTQIG